ncbi:hypothetical protein BDV19DRAFT_388847 [Aspergillus venezuelensis]
MKPSYINQTGHYSIADVRRMQRWNTAAKILDGIASVMAIPTVSTMLAYGAVIYTQRRRKMGQKEINIRQMFTLADKGWENVQFLWSALWKPREKRASPYLWLGFLLVLLATIQPPLRQILVQDEAMTLVTCDDQPLVLNNDDPSCDITGFYNKVIGHDPEPPYLALCPQDIVIQRALNKIIDVTQDDVQWHLWREVIDEPNFPMEDQNMNTFNFYYSEGFRDHGSRRGKFFVSSLVNGTGTGVLREHAIRMDTEVQCVVDNISFPDNCPGDRPFTTNYTSPALEVTVCGEGSFDRFPWNITRNKQELHERLWIKTQVNPSYTSPYTIPTALLHAVNYTMRCDAISRRGWFELGNYQNNFNYQPMLETWPTSDATKNEFNDISGVNFGSEYWPVEEESTDVSNPFTSKTGLGYFGTGSLPTPGPLMSAALALFGNGTLLQAAKDANTQSQQRTAALGICQHSRVPFFLYGDSNALWGMCYEPVFTEPDRDLENILPEMVASFMSLFDSPVPAQQVLEITAFFSNEALLMTTADLGSMLSRDIYTAPGYTILKPQLSVPGIVVMSVVIALQVAGILALLWFIHSAPSWTVSLNALTLARIGAQLHAQGKELDGFKVSGVMGFGEHDEAVQQQTGTSNGPTRRKVRILGLGETGVISEDLLEGKSV